MQNKLKLFNDRKIRTAWDEEREEWFFSVVDVVAVLTDSPDYLTGRKYWNKLKQRLTAEGSELVTICHQLKMQAADGKIRMTDVLETKGVLRLIQSIPSPKAEPFKLWLAEVGNDRLNEIADPEKAILRGADFYRAKGYSEGWINQRLQTIEMRKKLTDEWKDRGLTSDQDYAILTNEMTKAWSGMTVQEYKKYKDLKKENLRDNMTDIELVLNMLAEVTTTAISKKEKPETMSEHKKVARSGGGVAKNARIDIEQRLGQSAISLLMRVTKSFLRLKSRRMRIKSWQAMNKINHQSSGRCDFGL